MRRVGLSDLDVAARALLAAPRTDWGDVARALIEGAHTSDVWRKRHGSAHPAGGTGSLYAQASLRPCVPSSACEPPYCDALAVMLQALETWRNRAHKDV